MGLFPVQSKVMKGIPRVRNKVRIAAAIMLVAAFTWTLLTPTPISAESGQAFSISPPLLEIKTDPGKTVKATIKLTNISNGELLMKSQFNDFGAKNETGEPNIIFDDSHNNSYALRHWIAPVAPFKIASKQSKTIDFSIQVPEDAEPGGHYAVIRFTGSAPELEDSGVALSASIGTLVLLNVSGNVIEQASLTDFYAATPTFAKSGFFEQGPISFVERIRNQGNIHSRPTGTVEVTDMFGRKVETLRVNGDPANKDDLPKSVLPQSFRRFEQKLNQEWLFGQYHAKVNLTYGDGKKLSSEVSFWVIPYKLVILAIAGLVALFFALRFSLRKYNAHIINKSRRLKK
jgi:hypothetical protein